LFLPDRNPPPQSNPTARQVQKTEQPQAKANGSRKQNSTALIFKVESLFWDKRFPPRAGDATASIQGPALRSCKPEPAHRGARAGKGKARPHPCFSRNAGLLDVDCGEAPASPRAARYGAGNSVSKASHQQQSRGPSTQTQEGWLGSASRDTRGSPWLGSMEEKEAGRKKTAILGRFGFS